MWKLACRAGTTAASRRHRHHGQSRQPQRQAIRRLIRSAGAKLIFLPNYSPDLNPIEQVFAKLKHLSRKAAARTVEALCAAIGQLLGSFTSDECVNISETRDMPKPKCIPL
jgi:transposase